MICNSNSSNMYRLKVVATSFFVVRVLAAVVFYNNGLVVMAFTPLSLQQRFVQQNQQHDNNHNNNRRNDYTRIYMSGIGIAKDYSWKEDAYEIELSVPVPSTTRTKDILYKVTSTSIDVQLITTSNNNNDNNNNNTDPNLHLNPTTITATKSTKVLLDGTRKLRGRIHVDGTYWVLSDDDYDNDDITINDYNYDSNDNINNSNKNTKKQQKRLTITIEKIIATPKDDFDIIDYDWKGIYYQEYPNEIISRTYDKPEPFNVQEYAASMGIDINNLNMSMVDKTMFTSGLNNTSNQSKVLSSLQKAGYIAQQEIIQQRDGTEYVINNTTGIPEKISDNDDYYSDSKSILPQVQRQSQSSTATETTTTTAPLKPIPFLDTDSPWHTTITTASSTNSTSSSSASTTAYTNASIPSIGTIQDERKAVGNDKEEEALEQQQVIQLKRNFTRAAFIEDSMKQQQRQVQPIPNSKKVSNSNDPVDALTVVRLKEILASQGLSTTGNKQELQSRLRQQINALLQQ